MPNARWGGFALGVLLAGPAFAHPGVHDRLEAVEHRLAEEPEDAEALFRRAELHREDGRTAEALADYARAESLPGAPAELHLGRGLLLTEAGRLEEAEADLAAFLSAHPGSARGSLAWAALKVRTGPPAEAADAWDRAMQATADPVPEQFLAHAAALEAAARVEDAVAALDRGVARLGPVAALRLEAAELLVRAGRIEPALSRLAALAADSAQPAPIWVRHAELLQAQGRTDEARVSWSAAEAALLRLPVERRGSPRVRALYAAVRQALSSSP